MESIKVAVCDDEKNIAEVVSDTVKSLFKKHGVIADVEIFTSAAGLKRRTDEYNFNLVFLDISMPDADGIELGKILRRSNSKTDIIYISNREDRVFDALKVCVFGFVRKSHFLVDLAELIGRYCANVLNNNDYKVSVQSKAGTVVVRGKDIIYFEGSGKYQMMYIFGKEMPLAVYRTMEKLEEELAPVGFIRCHKGMLINYKYIERISSKGVELTDGKWLPISRRKVVDIKQRYMELLSNDHNIPL